MKRIKLLLFAILVLFIPTIIHAENTYKDNLYDIVGTEKTDTVTIYFFHQTTCPHCRKENLFLDELEEEYKDKLIVRRYEVSDNTNSEYLLKAKERMDIDTSGVPFTVIGDKAYIGYTESVGIAIEKSLNNYLTPSSGEQEEDSHIIKVFGKEINLSKLSIPVVAIVLGFIDGFNPCAMWVLLFLINMLFNMKNRKKMWLLGFTFLFTSAFVYFLAMLGISIVLSFTQTIWIRRIIAVVAIVGGIINLKSFVETPKDGCTVVDEKKRKNYFSRIKKFTSEENIFLALIGVIALAASVNLVELACSAGWPMIFTTILDLNNVSIISKIIYMLIYILFYLIDDLVVFVLAMITLKVTGITTKYNKFNHLVGGIIMIIIGLLLIFKPEILMLNF